MGKLLHRISVDWFVQLHYGNIFSAFTFFAEPILKFLSHLLNCCVVCLKISV